MWATKSVHLYKSPNSLISIQICLHALYVGATPMYVHSLLPLSYYNIHKYINPRIILQLCICDNPNLDAMNLLKMLLNAAHILHQIIGDPESFSAKKIRRQAEFAIDSVKVGRDVNVAGNGL